MRALRRLFRSGTVLFVLGVVPRSSSAQLLIITPDAEPAAVSHAELAYATGDGPPVTWLGLRLASRPVAVVAALPRGARAEAALDAWFAALERSSSPNILPPQSAIDCIERPGYVHVAWPRRESEPASELDLESEADVAAALEAQGLPVPEALPEADHYAVWAWAGGEGDETTRSLRVVGASSPLALQPGGAFPVLISGITAGPAQWRDELPNDELSVELEPGPQCDYRERLRDWLVEHQSPLLESRSRQLLFDWSILESTVSLPPLAASYARAASREQDFDADECAKQLGQLRRSEAPSVTACGGAMDFQLALLASGNERATLQRWVGSGANGFFPDRLSENGQARLPLLRAASTTESACNDRPPPILVIDPPTRGSTTGGRSSVVNEDTVVVESTTTDGSCNSAPGRDPYYDDRDTVACSSDTSSDAGNDDDCAGDSSSSGSDDTCSGDSSSSTDDDACSGDSSSSSSGSDGCASDSSRSEDSGCDGGSEDESYDGDTCTGSAAPRAEQRQKLQAAQTPRPRRVTTSLWSLAFVALALPIRRRKRRKI